MIIFFYMIGAGLLAFGVLGIVRFPRFSIPCAAIAFFGVVIIIFTGIIDAPAQEPYCLKSHSYTGCATEAR